MKIPMTLSDFHCYSPYFFINIFVLYNLQRRRSRSRFVIFLLVVYFNYFLMIWMAFKMYRKQHLYFLEPLSLIVIQKAAWTYKLTTEDELFQVYKVTRFVAVGSRLAAAPLLYRTWHTCWSCRSIAQFVSFGPPYLCLSTSLKRDLYSGKRQRAGGLIYGVTIINNLPRTFKNIKIFVWQSKWPLPPYLYAMGESTLHSI